MKNTILCFIAAICFAAVLNAQNQSLSAQYELVKWKWYDKSNSPLFDDYITTVALDEKGDKWIANGRDNGIMKFDGTGHFLTHQIQAYNQIIYDPFAPIKTDICGSDLMIMDWQNMTVQNGPDILSRIQGFLRSVSLI